MPPRRSQRNPRTRWTAFLVGATSGYRKPCTFHLWFGQWSSLASLRTSWRDQRTSHMATARGAAPLVPEAPSLATLEQILQTHIHRLATVSTTGIRVAHHLATSLHHQAWGDPKAVQAWELEPRALQPHRRHHPARQLPGTLEKTRSERGIARAFSL